MNRDNSEGTGKKTGTVVLTVAGVGLGIWASLVLADMLIFVWGYRTAQNMLEDYGLSIYAARLLAVMFAAAAAYFAGTVLWKVVKRDRKWVPIVAGVMAACFAVMYFISSPYTSGPFNPFSGKARATYLKLSDGTIKLFPKGLQFDPATGKKLKELDPTTAEEYQKQQGEVKKVDVKEKEKEESPQKPVPSKPGRIISSREEDNLELWIEKVELAPDRTILFMACQGRYGKGGLLPLDNPKDSDTYLVDASGQTYDLVSETIVENGTPQHWDASRGEYIGPHRVRADEVYHFSLTFKPVESNAAQLRLHIQWSEPALDLSSAFVTAEKKPPITTSTRR